MFSSFFNLLFLINAFLNDRPYPVVYTTGLLLGGHVMSGPGSGVAAARMLLRTYVM